MADRLALAGALAGAAAACALALPAGAAAQAAASPFGFVVQVSLSPKALAKLSAISESVTVSSFYHGKASKKPTAADITRAEADGEEPGQIELPGDTVTMPAVGGVANMPARGVTAADAAAYGRNPVHVNVNVFSARKAAEDNLLDCDLFDDRLAVARAKPVIITCRLIGEN
ncbi:hypothetical protein [Hansschlegelia sp. KR7-227]|uniref:hypothetical protein n=1 Tax=Hansschlegelia sp. KR7-227 TaxID=3400914 RepID=UPI003BFB1AB7